MPITLVTGTPGAGKTLYTVQLLVEKLHKQGRRIFHNISGLDLRELAKIGVNPFMIHAVGDDGPFEWFEYPDGSMFIFDEVQRQYPPRNTMSKVPKFISEYETHRHRGMDFYFITQGPRLIDRHLHDLITRHFHLYRAFGMKRSQVYSWNAVNPNPNPAQTKKNSVNAQFAFPKKMYRLYKSASLHTVKREIPWKIVVYSVGAVLLVSVAIYAVPGRIQQSISSGSNVAQDATDAFQVRCDGVALGMVSGALLIDTGAAVVRLPIAEIEGPGDDPGTARTISGMIICGVSLDEG